MRLNNFYAVLAPVFFAGAAMAQGPGSNPGTPVGPDGECPAGMTEFRPRRCMAPQMPAPSILDYRPRSTLVVPAHPVPRAKFPAVDFHGHISNLLTTPNGADSVLKSIDQLNIRVIIAADGLTGDRLKTVKAAVAASPKLKDRVRLFTGVDFRNVGPGWAEKVIAQLRTDAAAGAVGIGELSKGLGLSFKKADGSRLRIDDPELDPVWQEAARL
ncbi:MAG TPA: hypothetical protein VGC44_09385, partial [Longimicrobiales bacterium]